MPSLVDMLINESASWLKISNKNRNKHPNLGMFYEKNITKLLARDVPFVTMG